MDISIYDHAIAYFGRDKQMRKVSEEAHELGLAVTHFVDCKVSARELAEEMADIKIMLKQLVIMFPSLEAEMEEATKRKLKRLAERTNYGGTI